MKKVKILNCSYKGLHNIQYSYVEQLWLHSYNHYDCLLKNFPNLTKLSIQLYRLNDECLSTICHDQPKLRHLHLESGNEVDVEIIREQLQKLNSFRMKNGNVPAVYLYGPLVKIAQLELSFNLMPAYKTDYCFRRYHKNIKIMLKYLADLRRSYSVNHSK